MCGELAGEFLAFPSIARFGIDGALIAIVILAGDARERIIEPVDQA